MMQVILHLKNIAIHACKQPIFISSLLCYVKYTLSSVDVTPAVKVTLEV